MRAEEFGQGDYQVRMEWGQSGYDRLAPADIVVLVDVLGERSVALAAVEAGGTPAVLGWAPEGEVVLGGLRNAAAVAQYVLRRQAERGARTSVGVVALDDAGRLAVENQLGAGAIIAALGDLGIDHCSPEAAVTGEGFRALRGAARHLLTASGTGRALGADRRDAVLAAAALDAASVVPLRRDGAWSAA